MVDWLSHQTDQAEWCLYTEIFRLMMQKFGDVELEYLSPDAASLKTRVLKRKAAGSPWHACAILDLADQSALCLFSLPSILHNAA